MDPLVVSVAYEINGESTLRIDYQHYRNKEFNPGTPSDHSVGKSATEFIASNGMRLASCTRPAWYYGSPKTPRTLYLLGLDDSGDATVNVPTKHVPAILEAVDEYNRHRRPSITEF